VSDYYRAIPARGTHPGAYADRGEAFEHDPRGYHPDWQTGWQVGYTDGYQSGGHYGAPASTPTGVLDEVQYENGYDHGRHVAVYQWQLHAAEGTGPSPWWRKPDAEAPHGYQTWLVRIEVPADASTPRDAAAAAWDGLTSDLPPIVEVYPQAGSPADAVTVDLGIPEDEEGQAS
jgi:hypothetical protein